MARSWSRTGGGPAASHARRARARGGAAKRRSCRRRAAAQATSRTSATSAAMGRESARARAAEKRRGQRYSSASLCSSACTGAAHSPPASESTSMASASASAGGGGGGKKRSVAEGCWAAMKSTIAHSATSLQLRAAGSALPSSGRDLRRPLPRGSSAASLLPILRARKRTVAKGKLVARRAASQRCAAALSMCASPPAACAARRNSAAEIRSILSSRALSPTLFLSLSLSRSISLSVFVTEFALCLSVSVSLFVAVSVTVSLSSLVGCCSLALPLALSLSSFELWPEREFRARRRRSTRGPAGAPSLVCSLIAFLICAEKAMGGRGPPCPPTGRQLSSVWRAETVQGMSARAHAPVFSLRALAQASRTLRERERAAAAPSSLAVTSNC
mmetsp:Transcript_20714/g.79432  ORF Transcript_20714/g.79432 Transcript_20714/m.79432 type:complete len:389 (+) Transcript_20714:1389-2555(+)